MSTWKITWLFWWGWFVLFGLVALIVGGHLLLADSELPFTELLVFVPFLVLCYPLQRYSAWWTPYWKGSYAAAKGQHAEAVHHYRTALDTGRFAEDDPRFAAMLCKIGLSLSYIGDLPQAEALTARSHSVWRRICGADHPATLFAQVQWAMILSDLAQFRQAEAMLEDASQRSERSPASRASASAMSLATIWNNWAVVLTVQKKFARAEELYRRTLTLEEKTLRPGHLYFTMAYHNLAVICEKLDKLDEADAFLDRAKPLAKRYFKTPNYLHSSMRMVRGWIRLKQGRLQDAEFLARESLRHMEMGVGMESPLVARPLYLLARVLMARQQWEEAVSHCLRGLRLRETYMPPSHPEVADMRALHQELSGYTSQHIMDRSRSTRDALVEIRPLPI